MSLENGNFFSTLVFTLTPSCRNASIICSSLNYRLLLSLKSNQPTIMKKHIAKKPNSSQISQDKYSKIAKLGLFFQILLQRIDFNFDIKNYAEGFHHRAGVLT